MAANEVLICGAARTPMGGLLGALSSLPAPQLGATAITAALEKAGVAGSEVDAVLMGCVLAAGLGQAPARQAARAAGISDRAVCSTINKMCGSGMQALILGHDQIRAGSCHTLVAGGMENMSQAPYLLPKARAGIRMGHGEIIDSMFLDGLEDAYEGGLMGVFAQRSADDYQISRDAMDEFAIGSLNKALAATESGAFVAETAPVTVVQRGNNIQVRVDEQPGLARPDKIPLLKPAFKKDGTITAANASSISDGAAALLLSSDVYACQQGLQPVARIVAHASHAQLPAEFTLAPIGAIRSVLEKAGWHKDEVDLFEINEAFAVVSLLAIQQLALDQKKVNVFGGACALGHPLGSSGARIVVTLINALQQRGLKKGIASLCIGGGEATAIAIELV